MIQIDVPGWKTLVINRVVSDLNGTLALNGLIDQVVKDRIRRLSTQVYFAILTADTYGTASVLEEELGIRVIRLPAGHEREAKREHVLSSQPENTVFLGNGANDEEALQVAGLSICVLNPEGIFRECLLQADLVAPSPQDALDMLLFPKRIVAGMRR